MANKHPTFDLKPILSTNAQWFILMGGRNGGKSFEIKKFIVMQALEGMKFVYLRRYQDDMDVGSVLDYFTDVLHNKDGKNYFEIWCHGEYNDVKAAQKRIWAIKRNEEGDEDKTVKPFLIGYYGAVSKSQSFKSREKTDVFNFIYEEFIPEGTPLLPREPRLLESIVSSFGRSRTDIRVFLIGNEIDRDFYYFRYWNLDKIKRQKVNTIDVYEFENGDFNDDGTPFIVKFAVQLIPEGKQKGIFFGRGAKLNSTSWKTNSQPYMHQDDLENYECIYQVFFERHQLKWRARMFIDNNDCSMFWYVEPFTGGVIKDDERVVSDIVSINPFHSINIEPMNKFEQTGFALLKNGKCFFSDSLCGTEFKRAFATFMVNDLVNEQNEII